MSLTLSSLLAQDNLWKEDQETEPQPDGLEVGDAAQAPIAA